MFLAYLGTDIKNYPSSRTGILRDELKIPADVPLVGMVVSLLCAEVVSRQCARPQGPRRFHHRSGATSPRASGRAWHNDWRNLGRRTLVRRSRPELWQKAVRWWLAIQWNSVGCIDDLPRSGCWRSSRPIRMVWRIALWNLFSPACPSSRQTQAASPTLFATATQAGSCRPEIPQPLGKAMCEGTRRPRGSPSKSDSRPKPRP